MNKIILDIDQLKKERAEHEEAIKKIDAVINYYFNKDMTNEIAKNKAPTTTSNMTRMQKAIKICEDYLNKGNIVVSTTEFLKLMEKNGVKLSRAGIGLAFKMPESNIYYDQNSRTWKLKNRG